MSNIARLVAANQAGSNQTVIAKEDGVRQGGGRVPPIRAAAAHTLKVAYPSINDHSRAKVAGQGSSLSTLVLKQWDICNMPDGMDTGVLISYDTPTTTDDFGIQIEGGPNDEVDDVHTDDTMPGNTLVTGKKGTPGPLPYVGRILIGPGLHEEKYGTIDYVDPATGLTHVGRGVASPDKTVHKPTLSVKIDCAFRFGPKDATTGEQAIRLRLNEDDTALDPVSDTPLKRVGDASGLIVLCGKADADGNPTGGLSVALTDTKPTGLALYSADATYGSGLGALVDGTSIGFRSSDGALEVIGGAGISAGDLKASPGILIHQPPAAPTLAPAAADAGGASGGQAAGDYQYACSFLAIGVPAGLTSGEQAAFISGYSDGHSGAPASPPGGADLAYWYGQGYALGPSGDLVESGLSPATTYSISSLGATHGVQLTQSGDVPWSGGAVSSVHFWRTRAGGATFYYLAAWTSGTGGPVDNAADSVLTQPWAGGTVEIDAYVDGRTIGFDAAGRIASLFTPGNGIIFV